MDQTPSAPEARTWRLWLAAQRFQAIDRTQTPERWFRALLERQALGDLAADVGWRPPRDVSAGFERAVRQFAQVVGSSARFEGPARPADFLRASAPCQGLTAHHAVLDELHGATVPEDPEAAPVAVRRRWQTCGYCSACKAGKPGGCLNPTLVMP